MSGESNATNNARADRLNEMKMGCGCGACSWAGDSRGVQCMACTVKNPSEEGRWVTGLSDAEFDDLMENWERLRARGWTLPEIAWNKYFVLADCPECHATIEQCAECGSRTLDGEQACLGCDAALRCDECGYRPWLCRVCGEGMKPHTGKSSCGGPMCEECVAKGRPAPECVCGECVCDRRDCAPPGETEGTVLDNEARIERAEEGLERALCGTGDVAVVRRILLEYCKLEDMLRAGCGPVAELETALANSWALSEEHADLVFEADRNAGKRWWCFLPLGNGYGYGTEEDAKRYAEARGLRIAHQSPYLAQPDIEADGFNIAERLQVDEKTHCGECQCGECDGIECEGPPDDTHGGSDNRTRSA